MTAITTAKLVAPNSAQAVAQVYEFEQDGIHLSVIAATHFVSGVGETRDSLDSLLTLRGIAKNISTSFFQTKEQGTLFALKAAIEQVVGDHTNSRIKTLVAVVAIRDEFIHFATTPEMTVILLRNGMQHTLTKTSLTISSGSGRLSVVCSDGLKEGLGHLTSVDPETISEELHPQATEGSGYAGLFIHYEAEALGMPILEKEVQTAGPAEGASPKELTIVREDTLPQAEQPLTAVSGFDAPPQPMGGQSAFPGSGFVVRSKTSEFRANKKNKRMSVVGGALLLLLLASIVWGIKHKKVKDITVAADTQLSEISATLADIKASGFYNKERAAALFEEVDQKIGNVRVTPETEKNITQIREEIAKTREEVLGIFTQVTDGFLDLTLQSSGFLAKSLAFSSDTLSVLDSASNKVISVRLEGKRTESAGNTSDLGSVTQIARYADRTFAQVGTDFYELSNKSNKLLSGLPSESLFKLFAGNLYVVDRNENAIWRYAASSIGFADRNAWLSADTQVKLENALDMAIDGSIWVLSDNNKITKLNQGVLQTFKLTGMNLENAALSHIFVSEDTTSVYLLDQTNGKVYVFDKTGGYQSTYNVDGLENSVGFVVSETAKKAIFLLPQKLVSITLTHIK